MATFATLPLEIQMRIIKNVWKYSDLKSLCLTSKVFRRITTPILYRDVTLQFSQLQDLYQDFEKTPLLSTEHACLIKSLTIQNRVSTREAYHWDCNDDTGTYREKGLMYDENGLIRPKIINLQAVLHLKRSLNAVVKNFLRNLRKDQLICFRWLHRYPLLHEVVSYISATQGASLGTFYVTKMEVDPEMTYRFYEMSALSALEVVADKSHGEVLRLLTRPLRRLKLGSPNRIWETYLRTRPSVVEAEELLRFDGVLDMEDDLDCVLRNLECLESLELIGLDLDQGTLTGRGHNWTQRMLRPSLRRLVIESCANITTCFDELIKLSKTQHRLREFVFRHEAPIRDKVQKYLKPFFVGFRGLSLISVLLDNSQSMPDLEDCLQTHGPTLRQLVWESRTSPRVSKSEETSIPLKWQEVKMLCRLCPDLHELSIPLSHEDVEKSLTYIFRLSQLRTFHARNSLSTGRDEHNENEKSHLSRLENSVKISYRYAQTLMSILNDRIAMNGIVDPESRDSLDWWTRPPFKSKVMAFGPRIYGDTLRLQCGPPSNDEELRAIWLERGGDDGLGDMTFLRTHFYLVNHAYDEFGRPYQYLTRKNRAFPSRNIYVGLELDGNLTLEDIQEETSHTRVFESTWLR